MLNYLMGVMVIEIKNKAASSRDGLFVSPDVRKKFWSTVSEISHLLTGSAIVPRTNKFQASM